MSGEKIIVCFDGIKREIGIPFGICCTRQILEKISSVINEHLEDQTWSYGWTEISQTTNYGEAGSKPISWNKP